MAALPSLLTTYLTLLTEALATPSTTPDPFASYSISVLLNGLSSMKTNSEAVLLRDPTLLCLLLRAIDTIERRGSELLTNCDLQVAHESIALLVSFFANVKSSQTCTLTPRVSHFIRGSDALCALLYDLCASSASWSNRCFYLFLLTELQASGFDIHMTPAFLQHLLRSNESLTVRCATRLFVLNAPLFVEALRTLPAEERSAAIQFFAKTSLTEPKDVVPTKGETVHDMYSKDIQALLSRNLAIVANCALTDHDSVTLTVKNARSYVLWLYRVRAARWCES